MASRTKAKARKNAGAPRPTRTRRPAQERVDELRREIERIQLREAAKEARATPHGKALLAAVRAVDRAAEAAREAEEDDLVAALEAAREPLEQYLEDAGLPVPGRRAPDTVGAE